MANRKLTDGDTLILTDAPADGDLLMVVDISDTTEDPEGSSKAITFANLTQNLVKGPASATDGAVVLYDGATGKIVKDSEKTLSGIDSNIITGTPGTNNYVPKWNSDGDIVDGYEVLDEDDMSSNSATKLATQQSIKAYSDSGTQTQSNKTLTEPKIVSGGFIADANGNEQLIFVTTASAVNGFKMTNAATGGAPILEPSGETNIHAVVRAKGNGLLKTSILRQDATTDSYKHNSVILTGWGSILGNGTTALSASISFGITFAQAPVVLITPLGMKPSTTAPTAISELTNDPGSVIGFGVAPTTTGAGVRLKNITFSASNRYGYSWIAIGELA